MTSKAARLMLEREISALTNQIATARFSLATREFSLDASTEAMIAAQKALAMQAANLLYMRRKADVVSMEEFSKARMACTQAEDDVVSAQIDLLIDRSEISKCHAFIEVSKRRIETCRGELQSFGIVLAFPKSLS